MFNHPKPSRNDKWNRIKRLCAALVAVGLWVASMQFSYSGFGISTDNQASLAWLGIVLAIAITVIELVFNTDIHQLNLTLFASGIIAYVYGISTNILGFYSARGGTLDSVSIQNMWFPALVGLFLEVVPEPLFIWGIGASDMGDLLGNLFKSKDVMDGWSNTKNMDTDMVSRLPRRK